MTQILSWWLWRSLFVFNAQRARSGGIEWHKLQLYEFPTVYLVK